MKLGVPDNGREAISDIAARIFNSARCQRDLDARVGDFIAELHDQGWKTPQIGEVTWHDPPPHNFVLSDWCFAA